MKSLRELFESMSSEPWVVIGNAGRGRQTMWPRAAEPGVYSKEIANRIVARCNNRDSLAVNPNFDIHWHCKPLTDALEFVSGGNACYEPLEALINQFRNGDLPPLQTESITEDTDGLNVGDEVIITGKVQFNGCTGVIDSFGNDGHFVVVDLYNHGKHSFHSSDVSFNDYADSDEEEADAYERDPDARAWAHGNELDEAVDTKHIWSAGAEEVAAYLHRRYDGRPITKKEISKEYKAAGFPWGHRFMLGPDYQMILQYYNSMPKDQMSLELGEGKQVNEGDYDRAYALGKEHGVTGQKRQPPWPKGFPYDLMHKAYAMGYKDWRQKPAKKVKVGESEESAEDIDRQIEFHKQGQAAAQYKGSMNKKHAAKIRELLTKKEALNKKEVSEGEKPSSALDAKKVASLLTKKATQIYDLNKNSVVAFLTKQGATNITHTSKNWQYDGELGDHQSGTFDLDGNKFKYEFSGEFGMPPNITVCNDVQCVEDIKRLAGLK